MSESPAIPTNLQSALSHAARGWYVFPCGPDKRPLTPHGFKDATLEHEQIESWWIEHPDALIGIHCARSGFFVLDVDPPDGFESLQSLASHYNGGDGLIPGITQDTPRGGAHYLYRLPRDLRVPNNAGKLGPGLDLRSDGYICTGSGYTWLDGHSPDELGLTDAPALLLDRIRALKTPAAKTAPRKPQAENNGHKAAESGEYWLQKALGQAHEGTRNETGFWLACQLRDSGLILSEAEKLMCEYASQAPGPGYTESEAIASVRSAYTQGARDPARGDGFSAASLSSLAAAPGELLQPQAAGSDLPTSIPTPGLFKCDDIGNGERLRVRHGRKMRYVKERGWLVWTGKAWEEDRGQVDTWAKETARAIFAEAVDCEDQKQAVELFRHARNTANRSRRVAMVEACASEPGIPKKPADFDQDPWLLNVQNGIIDLRTGELRPHEPQAMLTKIAGTYYDPEADCPLWLRFLDRIFDGNPELIDFLQGAVGYSLTGNTIEQCLYFLYGSGANGKSTFTGAVQDMLGDYAQKTRAETFLQKHSDQIPEDVARLAGVRFALAAELTGGHLNESLVKDLTGGDRLAARFLHHNTFEFKPVVKLWLYGNAKPTISETTEGIWRRVRLVPFTVIIPENERDGKLPEKLRTELPGILAWAVRGCLAWQREGLSTPAAVKLATDSYRQEQDEIGRFLAECCVCEDGKTATAGVLYQAYQKWGGGWSQRRFSQAMGDHGYKTDGRDGAGRAIYRGVGLFESAGRSASEGESWQN
jgi:putative DNA primase/helicase